MTLSGPKIPGRTKLFTRGLGGLELRVGLWLVWVASCSWSIYAKGAMRLSIPQMSAFVVVMGGWISVEFGLSVERERTRVKKTFDSSSKRCISQTRTWVLPRARMLLQNLKSCNDQVRKDDRMCPNKNTDPFQPANNDTDAIPRNGMEIKRQARLYWGGVVFIIMNDIAITSPMIMSVVPTAYLRLLFEMINGGMNTGHAPKKLPWEVDICSGEAEKPNETYCF